MDRYIYNSELKHQHELSAYFHMRESGDRLPLVTMTTSPYKATYVSFRYSRLTDHTACSKTREFKI